MASHQLPWLTLNRFLRERFGQRVQKIPVDAGLSCPNRDPVTGRGGCIYCNQLGSGTGAWQRGQDISQQVLQGMEWAKRRYRAGKFLIYFQSFSNTFAPLERLEEIYSSALCSDDIVGVCIGTRPDCIDRQRLRLIWEFFREKMVWMEYGLQSASNLTLSRINRGHTVEDFIHAVDITREFPFYICAHVIFGLPGEDQETMLDTVRLVSELHLDGIKFHQLYLVKDTPMAELYRSRKYEPMSQYEYASIVARSLKILPQDLVVQRLVGDPGPGELIAPAWSRDKQGTIHLIKSLFSGRIDSKDPVGLQR